MDLKRLAGERLMKMLEDGTGHPPKTWTKEHRALQAHVADILDVDPSSLSKAIRDCSIALDFISSVSVATGVKPTYFVDTSVSTAAVNYRDFLTRGDPFAAVQTESPTPDVGGDSRASAEEMFRQAQAMLTKAMELAGKPRRDEALTAAVRRGAHGGAVAANRAPSPPDAHRSPSDRVRRRRDTPSGADKRTRS